MRRFGVVAVSLLVGGSVSLAHAAGIRRHTPQNRPYIVELGAPEAIDDMRLQREMRKNTDLRGYVARYGYPEVAEIQEIVPQSPWDSYEVRLYYIRRNQALAFSRAFISPIIDDFGLLKHTGKVLPEDRARFVKRGRYLGEDPAARLEDAVEQAAAAAADADASSRAAEEAAQQAGQESGPPNREPEA